MKFLLLKIGFVSLMSFGLFACSSVDNKWNVNNSWCKDTNTVAMTEETIVLSSDLFFKFNGSSLTDITSEGREQLANLAKSLKNHYQTINKIILVGHTDRIGSDNYNLKLGFARANTIKDYLMSEGIDTIYVLDSKGKSEPITTNCIAKSITQELKACLQPDRRVVLHIEGLKN